MRKIVTGVLALIILTAVLPALAGAQDKAQQFQALLQEGERHFMQQNFEGAILSFQKATELEPKSGLAYNVLGMAFRMRYHQVASKELKDKEIAAFSKAIEVDPGFWPALINLGATYYYMGEKGKAAPLFKKALAINPQHPEKAQIEKMIAEGEGQP